MCIKLRYSLRFLEVAIICSLFVMAYFGHYLTYLESSMLALLLFACIELITLGSNLERLNKFNQLLKKNSKSAKSIVKMVSSLSTIFTKRHISIQKITENKLSEFCSEIESLSHGSFNHERSCMQAFGKVAIYTTGSSIDAVSSFLGAGRHFWNSKTAGALYLDANIWAVENDIRVRRIFLATELTDFDWNVLFRQEKSGIEVLVALVSAQDSVEECFIIQDRSFLSTTYFDNKSRIIGWSQTEEKKRVNSHIEKFEKYLRLSTPIKKIEDYAEQMARYEKAPCV